MAERHGKQDGEMGDNQSELERGMTVFEPTEKRFGRIRALSASSVFVKWDDSYEVFEFERESFDLMVGDETQ